MVTQPDKFEDVQSQKHNNKASKISYWRKIPWQMTGFLVCLTVDDGLSVYLSWRAERQYDMGEKPASLSQSNQILFERPTVSFY